MEVMQRSRNCNRKERVQPVRSLYVMPSIGHVEANLSRRTAAGRHVLRPALQVSVRLVRNCGSIVAANYAFLHYEQDMLGLTDVLDGIARDGHDIG